MNSGKRKKKNKNVSNINQVQAYVEQLQLNAKSHKNKKFQDIKNRRIVSKELLYEEIEMDYGTRNNTAPAQSSWTDSHWKRENTQAINVQTKPKLLNLPKSKLEKKLTAAVSQPVNAGKAANMMLKMGWQGGPLGKSGSGITVPIVPNVAYATKTIGLGAFTKETKRKPLKRKQPKNVINKKDKKKIQKEVLVTNALKVILDFVKNPRESQIIFDPTLSNKERRLVHTVVNSLINGDDDYDEIMMCGNDQQADLVDEICEFNNYILKTESEGKNPNRTLCLYKEASAHVYLIQPEDLTINNENDDDDGYDDYDLIDDESELYIVSDDDDNQNNVTSNDIEMKSAVDDKISSSDTTINNTKNIEDKIISSNNKVMNIDIKSDVKNAIETQNDESKNIATTSEVNSHNSKENSSKDIRTQVTNTENYTKGGEMCHKNKEKDLNNVKIDRTDNTNSITVTNNDTKAESMETEDIQVNINNANAIKTNASNTKKPNDNKSETKSITFSKDKVNEAKIIPNDIQNESLNAINKGHTSIDTEDEITKDLPTENETLDIQDKLIDYLKDFVENKDYTEFRFLGAFNDEEVEGINEFITSLHYSCNGYLESKFEIVINCIEKEKCYIECGTDINLGIVIYKMPNEDLQQ